MMKKFIKNKIYKKIKNDKKNYKKNLSSIKKYLSINETKIYSNYKKKPSTSSGFL